MKKYIIPILFIALLIIALFVYQFGVNKITINIDGHPFSNGVVEVLSGNQRSFTLNNKGEFSFPWALNKDPIMLTFAQKQKYPYTTLLSKRGNVIVNITQQGNVYYIHSARNFYFLGLKYTVDYSSFTGKFTEKEH